jgi:ribosome production factor 2
MVLGQIGAFKRRQPKSARSRRELKKKEPKAFENPKKILFLKGLSTNTEVTDAMNDLFAITKPHCKRLKKRNAFNPFEGVEHLGFLGFKNDCSMFCFGSNSKKRKNNLTIGRMFDFQLLDMVEFGILAMDRLELGDAKGTSAASLGSKPLFVFEGSEFESDPYFVRMKNLIVDFFRGTQVKEANLTGIDRAIFVALRSVDGSPVVAPSDDCRGTKPPTIKGNAVLRFRHYAITKQGSGIVSSVSAKSVEQLNLVDIGPNFDWEIRRTFFSPSAEFKRACRLSKEEMQEQVGAHENVSGDLLGNVRGQLHVGKQDLTQLSLRRFKAGKEQRKAARGKGAAAGDGDGEGEGDDGESRKRKRPRHAEEDFFALQGEADI